MCKVSEKVMEKRLQARRESLERYTRAAAALVSEYRMRIRNGEELHASISEKNSKIGQVFNVSLAPIISCGAICSAIGCDLYCYARYSAVVHGYAGIVMQAWCKNLALYLEDPDTFFEDITDAMRKAARKRNPKRRLFRWHVGGEIPSYDYLLRMVKAARDVPECRAWCYTTRVDLLERYERENGRFPENLQMLVSAGPHGERPSSNYPCTCIIPAETETPETVSFVCPGKCAKCNYVCAYAKSSAMIGFNEH